MNFVRNLNFGVFFKPTLAVRSLVIAFLLGVLFLFNGCVKMGGDAESRLGDTFHRSPLCQP